MPWYDVLGYCITIVALIGIPIVVYKLLKTPPRNRMKVVEEPPVVSQYDLPFVERIMELVRSHEATHNIQPRLQVVSAENYIVQTNNSSGGRNPMSHSETHDLRTRKGIHSFEASCQYALMEALFFLDGTNPKQRASIYKSGANEFHRDDLEPWMSILDVVRKRNGFV